MGPSHTQNEYYGAEKGNMATRPMTNGSQNDGGCGTSGLSPTDYEGDQERTHQMIRPQTNDRYIPYGMGPVLMNKGTEVANEEEEEKSPVPTDWQQKTTQGPSGLPWSGAGQDRERPPPSHKGRPALSK